MEQNKETENVENKEELKEKVTANNKKKIGTYIFRTMIAFLLLSILYIAVIMIERVQAINNIFEYIEEKEVYLTEYVVYGNHLNIKGKMQIEDPNINNLKLCFKSTNKSETKEIDLKSSKNKNDIEFYLSDLINEGIDLEELDSDMYYLLIKTTNTDGINKYYSIKNNTKYSNITYYTITKNSKNKKVNIAFDTYNNKLNYMYINVYYDNLPDDVFDIVIDAGHGGKDVGAEANGYREADLTLKFAYKITRELEASGFKVKMTRDGTEGDELNVYSTYDENGRINIIGASKAKYVFSIHLNSINIPNSQKGVEIYAPTRINLDLARALAKNIVEYGKTKYSELAPNYRVEPGVYVRTFTKESIEESIKTANEKGFEPYKIYPYTPYLYMLRETGGIITGAYIDGRNPDYGKNLYLDSNIGVEAYLLELGYINNKSDLQNMIENEDGYVEGIVKTIKDEIYGKI